MSADFRLTIHDPERQALWRHWPTPRADLVNQLWTLALCYGAKLPAYDALVPAKTTLVGRALEPWRALLAVAHWLTECGVEALSDRMTALSLAYQQERPDLEPTDLTTLTLRSLCHYAIHSMSAVNSETPDTHDIIFSTADITDLAKQLIVDDELSINAEQVSVRRIGRVCGGDQSCEVAAMTRRMLFSALCDVADALEQETERLRFSPHKLALDAIRERLDVIIDEMLEEPLIDDAPPRRPGEGRWLLPRHPTQQEGQGDA